MRKQNERLGFKKGVSDIQAHPWFKGFNWTALHTKTMKAPWVPPKGDNFKYNLEDFPNENA